MPDMSGGNFVANDYFLFLTPFAFNFDYFHASISCPLYGIIILTSKSALIPA